MLTQVFYKIHVYEQSKLARRCKSNHDDKLSRKDYFMFHLNAHLTAAITIFILAIHKEHVFDMPLFVHNLL